MKFYRFTYVAVSYLLLIAIYLINQGIAIGSIMKGIGMPCPEIDLPNIVSYITYLAIDVFCSWIMKKKFKNLEDIIPIRADNIKKISPTGDSFLVSFFAYIFLGLSINNNYMLATVYIALTIMCFATQLYLYNPIFLLFGYNYYNVSTKNGLTVIILTKQKFGLNTNVDFPNLRRLNDYTYIDLKS